MNRIGLLLCVLLSISKQVIPQYQDNLPKAKPIPPNAAAMFKVLDRPVGTYTGTVPINFPLCSINSGALSADVSLSYNSTGGIRVEELASCAGLGFNLNDGGGRITQMVRDKSDLDPGVGRIFNTIKPSGFNSSDNDHLWLMQEKQIDLEPDVFMYSIPGHSGKFFLKENGDVVLMTNDKVKIEYAYGWVITNDIGTKHIFDLGLENYSTYSGNGGSSESSPSSNTWYLTRIEDMNNENSITFSYTETSQFFTTISGSIRPLTLAYTSDCSGFNTTFDVGTVTTEGGEYLVSRIDGSSGYLLFNYVTDYLYGPKRLTRIDNYDSSGNFKNKFRFNYGTSFSSSRWKLINFSEFGSSGTDSLTYKFTYEESVNLPDVLSPGVDIWGYYNGYANYNTGLIPNLNYTPLSITWNGWATRTASGASSMANILKKITWPTGGYRTIEYEGNKVQPLGDFFQYHPGAGGGGAAGNNAGGVRIKEIRDYDPVSGKTNKTEYRYKRYATDSAYTSGLLAGPVNITATENIWDCGCEYTKVFPGSSYPLAMDGGSYVVYSEVRTIDSAKGWTDHLYSYAADDLPSGFPVVPPIDYSWYRGNLVQERVYDKNGNLLKKTVNDYGWNIPQTQLGIRIKPYWYLDVFGPWTEFAPAFGNYNDMFFDGIADMTAYNDYSVGQPVVALWQSIDSIYGAGGAQGIKTDYRYYEYNGRLFLKNKTVTLHGGQKKEQSYKYAFTNKIDFRLGLTAGEQTMKSTLLTKNYLQPLEVVDSLRSAAGTLSFLQGAKYIFGTFNTNKIHLSKYRAFTTATDSSEINFSGYDNRGNLTEQYSTNVVKEVTLWGYRGLFPVAKVVGSDYITVAALVNLAVLNTPSTEGIMRTELDKIRAGLAAAGSKALVTTYTYSYRYGMTSATDAAGRTIYYEYDHLGRLKLVRDHDNRILKKYEYSTNQVF